MKKNSLFKLLVLSSAVLLAACSFGGKTSTEDPSITPSSETSSAASSAAQSSSNTPSSAKSSSKASSAKPASSSRPVSSSQGGGSHTHSYTPNAKSDHTDNVCSCGENYLSKDFKSIQESATGIFDGEKLNKGKTLTWKFTIDAAKIIKNAGYTKGDSPDKLITLDYTLTNQNRFSLNTEALKNCMIKITGDI